MKAHPSKTATDGAASFIYDVREVKIPAKVGQPALAYFNKYNGILENNRTGDAFTYRGRGYIQITGKSNYQNWSNELSTNLVASPGLAATPDIAAEIAVEGLDKGSFTGVSLYNYVNPDRTNFTNARATVNGDTAKNGAAIANIASGFSNNLSGCR